ncbi:MAG: hypothetical protein V8R50_10820 [Clostridia bacterium]
MRVLELLEEIEEIVDTAAGFPLTGKIMVDSQELLEIVREIRAELPDEIQQAQWIKNERERIIAEAKTQYEAVIDDAQKQADALVENNDITVRAKMRADELMQVTESTAKQLKIGTYDYLDSILYSFQGKMEHLSSIYFGEMFTSIEKAFDDINSALAANREELKTCPTGRRSMQKKCRSRHLLQALSRLRGKKSNRIPGRDGRDKRTSLIDPWFVNTMNHGYFLWQKKTNDHGGADERGMLHPDGHIPAGSHGFSQKRDLSLGVQRSAGTAAFFYLCEFSAEHRRDTVFEIGYIPVLMSVLSGYPMGAKIVGDLRRSSEISVGEAKRLMSFCSTSGPAFLIGAVGTGMLGSGFLGGIIAAAHYLGAAVNGMVYTAVLGKECGFAGSMRIKEEKGMQESLTEAMLSAFKSLGIILAYIVLFTFATDMMHLCGVFSLVGCTWLRAIVKGFLK